DEGEEDDASNGSDEGEETDATNGSDEGEEDHGADISDEGEEDDDTNASDEGEEDDATNVFIVIDPTYMGGRRCGICGGSRRTGHTRIPVPQRAQLNLAYSHRLILKPGVNVCSEHLINDAVKHDVHVNSHYDFHQK
ncbi:unnamed protein product, partial [Owenia fusiformis]